MFQSPLPRGVRRSAPAISRHGSDGFNPRTRVGCDLRLALKQDHNLLGFQSTHPRGVRRRPGSRASTSNLFQSTHPRGVRPAAAIRANRNRRRFNPRTRVGCDAPELAANAAASFNPRTRVGCDRSPVVCAKMARLFQSTHPRGVRLRRRRSDGYAGISFNPRTRVGCDTCRASSTCWRASFNPRTRVGCDVRSRMPSPMASCFNPRTRVGCDRFSFSVSSIPERFQSTHPRGVRLTLSETLGVELGGFNPRTRVGCDMYAP